METVLTEEMKAQIKAAKTINDCDFKCSYNKFKRHHRVMIRGEITKDQWVCLGSNKITEFESAAQARLFIAEMKAEFKARKLSEV